MYPHANPKRATSATSGLPLKPVPRTSGRRRPAERPIQALAKISRMLTDEAFRTQIKQAADAEQLWAMIEKSEQQAVS